jgi:hypothetical protein
VALARARTKYAVTLYFRCLRAGVEIALAGRADLKLAARGREQGERERVQRIGICRRFHSPLSGRGLMTTTWTD